MASFRMLVVAVADDTELGVVFIGKTCMDEDGPFLLDGLRNGDVGRVLYDVEFDGDSSMVVVCRLLIYWIY